MRDSQKPILNRLVKCLRKYPQQMIKITGHTDPLKPNYGEGSKFSNVILGLKRAETMVKALVQLKFNAGRFIVIRAPLFRKNLINKRVPNWVS